MTAILFENVSKQRGTGRRAVDVLRNVSFSLAEGEVVLLTGPSGSGKTTLLGLAAGLLSADAGRIEIHNTRLEWTTLRQRVALRSRAIGVVFQRPSLLSGLTARENVHLMARLSGMTAKDARAQTSQLFERLGIGGLADRYPHQLSGGEEQRVGIARALVHGPPVILADEPTASLDAGPGDAVAALLQSVAAERAVAVLIATHDLRLRRFASRFLQLAGGTLLEAGASSEGSR